jgi:hypothetical protein
MQRVLEELKEMVQQMPFEHEGIMEWMPTGAYLNYRWYDQYKDAPPRSFTTPYKYIMDSKDSMRKKLNREFYQKVLVREWGRNVVIWQPTHRVINERYISFWNDEPNDVKEPRSFVKKYPYFHS